MLFKPKSSGCSGRWKKQRDLCDSMEPAFEAINMPWLYKKAAAFLDTVDIEDRGSNLQIKVKAGGILDILEVYPLDGSTVENERRDKRSGRLSGRMQNFGNSFIITNTWGEPYPGRIEETFSLSEGGKRLTQKSELIMVDESKSCSYTTTYQRVGIAKPRSFQEECKAVGENRALEE